MTVAVAGKTRRFLVWRRQGAERLIPRIRLRLGIALVFIGVIVPLTVGMVATLYYQNAALAVDLAQQSMDVTTQDVVDKVRSMLAPIARVVDMTVAFAKVDRNGLHRPESFRPMIETLEQVPDLYSIYYGSRVDGAFSQAIRLPAGLKAFGPAGEAPPPQARFVMRMIDGSSGAWKDSYIYLGAWGYVLRVERGDVTYDPRKRPWYAAALKTHEVATSGIYVYASSGRPGLTLSKQLTTDNGEVVGVVGADLTTDSLSRFLADRRIGKSGIAFILDEDGGLIGFPHPEMAVHQDGNKVTLIKGVDVADKVVASAIRMHNSGSGNRFRAALGDDRQVYLVSFAAFPDDFGKNWTIGTIAAEDDFVQPLRRASLQILVIGVVFILIAAVTIVILSRRLTRPIQAIIGETQLIRDLVLDTPFKLDSSVIEIHALAQAMALMKVTLRSFGAYVPKALVKSILDSGVGIAVGGERREISVMFTDIAGFSKISEAMPPEDLLDQLSAYVEVMSQTIHAHHGAVDKFIGDAVMALFNAPALDHDHILHACATMLACRRANRQLNRDFQARGLTPLKTRYGLHTGLAIVGNLGSHDRMQYTALGGIVNLASRIEGLNKVYGTELLVTGPVEAVANRHFLLRPIDLAVPVGTSVPVPLFELIGALDLASPDCATRDEHAACAAWALAYAAYARRDWVAAAEAFAAYSVRYPGDEAAQLLAGRCQEFQADPPPPDWDGAIRFNQK